MKNTKTYFSPVLVSTRRNKLYLAIATQFLLVTGAQAAPTGGQVVGGAGSIEQSGNQTTILQETDRLSLDWESFNIAADESVRFVQPGADSVALNRILGNDASNIFGNIEANGQIILMNPNGVFFSETATVNVGSLVASGLAINPNDFMNGDFTLDAMAGADGAVINHGIINAATGGRVVLVGQKVENRGLISAKLGSVSLAAGKRAVLTFDRQGLLGVRVTEAVLQDDIGVDPAVQNSGEITAEGGQVLLTASVSEDIFSQAVNSGELNRHTSVVVHDDGSFTLGRGANLVNTGTVDVSGDIAGDVVILGENIQHGGEILADGGSGEAGHIEIHGGDTTLLVDSAEVSASAEQGGDIKILGKRVGLTGLAQVHADGTVAGGQVLVGGDQQGLNTQVRNADFVYLGDSAVVSANAIASGAGGRVIAFAETSARLYGELEAKGGVQGGDGGFVETSGKSHLELDGVPDVSAVNGKGGEWLIDPYDITIDSGVVRSNVDEATGIFNAIGNSAELDVADVQAALNAGTSVTVTAGTAGSELGNITLAAPIVFTGTSDSNLTLVSSNDILINADINYLGSAPATLTFNAGNNIDLNGNIDASAAANTLEVVLNSNLGGGTGSIRSGGTLIHTRGGDLSASGYNIDLAGVAIATSNATDRSGSIDALAANNLAVGTIGNAIPGPSEFTIELSLNAGNSLDVQGNISTNGGTVDVSGNTLTFADGITINTNSLGGVATDRGDVFIRAVGDIELPNISTNLESIETVVPSQSISASTLTVESSAGSIISNNRLAIHGSVVLNAAEDIVFNPGSLLDMQYTMGHLFFTAGNNIDFNPSTTGYSPDVFVVDETNLTSILFQAGSAIRASHIALGRGDIVLNAGTNNTKTGYTDFESPATGTGPGLYLDGGLSTFGRVYLRGANTVNLVSIGNELNAGYPEMARPPSYLQVDSGAEIITWQFGLATAGDIALNVSRDVEQQNTFSFATGELINLSPLQTIPGLNAAYGVISHVTFGDFSRPFTISSAGGIISYSADKIEIAPSVLFDSSSPQGHGNIFFYSNQDFTAPHFVYSNPLSPTAGSTSPLISLTSVDGNIVWLGSFDFNNSNNIDGDPLNLELEGNNVVFGAEAGDPYYPAFPTTNTDSNGLWNVSDLAANIYDSDRSTPESLNIDIVATGNISHKANLENNGGNYTLEGKDIVIDNDSQFNIGGITADNLDLILSNNITQSGDLNVSGHTSIAVANGDYTVSLSRPTNQLNTLAIDASFTNGGAVLIEESDGVTINHLNSNGTVNVYARDDGSSIIQTGDWTMANATGSTSLNLAANLIELGDGGKATIDLGSNTLNITEAQTLSIDGPVSGGISSGALLHIFADSAVDATLIIGANANFDNIDAASYIALAGGNNTADIYSDIPFSLQLGDGDDLVNLSAPGLTIADLDGGAGVDAIFDLTPQGAEWILSDGVTGTGSVQSVGASGAPVNFTGVEIITAGTGDDIVQLNSSWPLSIDLGAGDDSVYQNAADIRARIAGGPGTDAFYRYVNVDGNWVIDGAANVQVGNDGDPSVVDAIAVALSGFETLTGADDVTDWFLYTDTDFQDIGIQLYGGVSTLGENDLFTQQQDRIIIDASAPVDLVFPDSLWHDLENVELNGSAAVLGASTFTIPGGVPGQDSNIWAIYGGAGPDLTYMRSGVSDTLHIRGFRNFVGEGADDQFNLEHNPDGLTSGLANVNLSLDGGAGNNRIQLTSDEGSTWNLANAVSSIQGFSWSGAILFRNVQSLIGADTADTIDMADNASFADITTGAGDDVITISGSNVTIDSLYTGTGSDTVVLAEDTTINGVVDGGVDNLDDGLDNITDILDLSSFTQSNEYNFATGQSSINIDAAGFEDTQYNTNAPFTLLGGDGDLVWTFDGNNNVTITDGIQTDNFANVLKVRSGVGKNQFNFTDGARFNGEIEGTSAGDNTLTANNVIDTWIIDGINSGQMQGESGALVTTFTNIANLIGSGADETFTLTDTGSITGSIDAGAGLDTFEDRSSTAKSWRLGSGLASVAFISDATNVVNFTGMEDLVLSSANDVVQLTGNWAGQIALGDGDDQVIQNSAEMGVQLDGGLGRDSFMRYTGSDGDWTIAADGSVVVQNKDAIGEVGLTNIESLIGADEQKDSFIYLTENYDSIGISLDGGSGASVNVWDWVQFSDVGPVHVVYPYAPWANIEVIDLLLLNASPGSSFTLAGGASGQDANAWEMFRDSADVGFSRDGASGRLLLQGFDQYIGDDADDLFNLSYTSGGGLGEVSYSLDGGAGNNTLRLTSAESSSWQLGQSANSVQGETWAEVINFSNIQNIISTEQVDNFTVGSGANYSDITTGAGDDLFTVVGSNVTFNNLATGSGSDTVVLAADTVVNGAIDGGTETVGVDDGTQGVVDILDISAFTGQNEYNFATGESSLLTVSTTNFEQVTDPIGGTLLFGGDIDVNWLFENDTTITLTGNGRSESFSGLTSVKSGRGINNFVLADNARFNGAIEADAAGTNSLTANNVIDTWIIDGINSGQMQGDNGALVTTFTNIATLIGSGGNDVFTLADGATVGAIDSGAGDDVIVVGANVTFANGLGLATNLVTGDGADSISIGQGSILADLLTGAGDDLVDLADNVSLANINAGGGDDRINLAAGVTISGSLDGGSTDEVNGDLLDVSVLGVVLAGLDPSTVLGFNVINFAQYIDALPEGTFVAGNGSNYWFITGENSGYVESVVAGQTVRQDFTDRDTLKGGDNLDVFIFANDNAAITTLIDGGQGDNSLAMTWEDSGNSLVQNLINTWLIDGVNRGNVQNSSNSTGNVFNNIASILGGGNQDLFTVQGSGTLASLSGGAGVDQLTVDAGRDNLWQINTDLSSVNGSVSFADVEQLVGDLNNDRFQLLSDNTAVRQIDGGLGDNQLEIAFSEDATIDLALQTIGTLLYSNINTLVGTNGNHVIQGASVATDWLIEGDNRGSISFLRASDGNPVNIDFVGLGALQGGSGDDQFVLAEGAALSIGITGGDGADAIVSRATSASDWAISALDAGAWNGQVSFAEVERAQGSAGQDNFNVSSGAGMTAGIDGGAGNDRIEQQGVDNQWAILFDDTNGPTLIGGQVAATPFVNIEQWVGSGVNDTLSGADFDSSWSLGDSLTNSYIDIDGSPAHRVAFSGMENVLGGAANDTFNLVNAASLPTIIKGGDGTDSVNLQNVATDIAVAVASSVELPCVCDSITLDTIENLQGNAQQVTTLYGAGDQSYTWTIDGLNSGQVTASVPGAATATLGFTNISAIRGGAHDDIFQVAGNSTLISMDGGDQISADVIDYSRVNANLRINLAQALTGQNGEIAGVEGVRGNNTGVSSLNNAELVAGDGDNLWTIADLDGVGFADGINDGDVSDGVTSVRFMDFNILTGGAGTDVFNQDGGVLVGTVNGGAGNDTMNVKVAGVNRGTSFDGGTGRDSLVITGADAATQVIYSSSALGGQFQYDSADTSYTMAYVSVSDVHENSSAPGIQVRGTNAVDTIALTNGRFAVNGSEGVRYNNKLDLIIRADAADTIEIADNLAVENTLALFNGKVITNDADNTSITAQQLILDSTADVGSINGRIRTNVSDLRVRSALGDIALQEQNGLNLAEFLSAGETDLLLLNGDLTNSDIITAADDFIVTTQAGNVVLQRENQITGNVRMTVAGDLLWENDATMSIASLSAVNANLAGRGIDAEGAVRIAEDLILRATNDIIMENPLNDFNRVTILDGRNVSLVDQNSLQLVAANLRGYLWLDALGLKLAGNLIADAMRLNANAGSVIIDGNLNTAGGGDIAIDGNLIVQNGHIVSGRSTSLTSTTSISQNGSIDSRGDVSASALGGDIIAADGTSIRGNTVTITASGNLQVQDVDSEAVNISGGELVVTGGSVHASRGDINVTSGSYTMSVNSVLESEQGTIRISATDNVETSADMTGSEVVIVAGDVTLGGNVTATQGTVKIDSISKVDVNQSVSGNSGVSIAAGNGSVSQAGTISANTGSVSVTAGSDGDVLMGVDAKIGVNQGDVNISAGRDVVIADVSTSGTVKVVTETGGVSDGNGSGNNITAEKLVTESNTGVGQGDALETRVTDLNVVAKSGDVDLHNDGSVNVTKLQTQGGNVNFENDGNVLLGGNSVVAKNAGGTSQVNIATNKGDVLQSGAADIPAVVSDTIDVTAENRRVDFRVEANVVRVAAESGRILRNPGSEATLYFSGSFKFEDQILAVEPLEDVNPAVFANVKSYFYNDISLRLPEDQLYEEDEDDSAEQ